MSTAELVTNYMEGHGLSYRQMAEQISAVFPPISFTYQSIWYWAHGQSTPGYAKLVVLHDHASGDLKELFAALLREAQHNRQGITPVADPAG